MNQAGFVQIPGDKRQFVVGLSWKVEDKNPSAKRVRALAAERGRWICRRKTMHGSFQVGFCDIEHPAKRGSMTSLAAAMANAKPEPWLGIFRLGEDLYWYIAVRDNQSILPDGDLLGSQEQIKEARARHTGLGDWNFCDGDIDTIVEMLGGNKASWLVTDSHHRPWVKPTVAATCVLVIGGGGLLAAKKHEHDVLVQRQIAIQRQAALDAAMAAKQPKPTPILPWTQLASSTSFFQACAAAFSNTPLSDAGWILTRWECDQSPGGSVAVKTAWERAGGDTLDTPIGMLSNHGNTIQGGASAVTRLAAFAGPPLLQGNVAERVIRAIGQNLDMPMQLTMPRPEAAPAVQTSGSKPPPPPPWLQGSVVLKVPAPPWSLGIGPYLDLVPGLRMTSVAWDGQFWALSGQSYTANQIRLQPPPQPDGPHAITPITNLSAINPPGVVHVD